MLLALLRGAALAAEPLVLALSRTPLSLPFYVAESEGYFVAEGVAVKINEVLGGHRTMQLLLEGQADLATSSETVAMFSSFKRDDFAIIASFVSSTDDVKLIVGGHAAISHPADLAGKRVGTVLGAASQYYLDTLLLLAGTDPKSVKLVGLQPETMAGALRQKEVDAVAVWQPTAYRLEREIDGARALPDGSFYTLRFNLIVARRHLGRRDDELVRLLRALERAQRLIASQPAKAQAILRSRLLLEQAYIDWLWPRYRYQLSLDQALLTTLESEARWARDEGLVAGKRSPNYMLLIYSPPLRSTRPAAVAITE